MPWSAPRSAIGGLIASTLILTAGCGQATPAGSGSASGSSGAAACPLDRLDGCAVFGLVLEQAAPLGEALSIASGYGTALAVYPEDWACTLSISMAPPGAPETREATRFAYVDAAGIRARRLAAAGSGQAPPITGMFISESYWDHWEDQWDMAQEPAVAIAAVAVYMPPSREAQAAEDPGLRAVVPIPSRRTDSLIASYAGELLLQEESFPAGYLPDVPAPACG
jgi:hypothetical protein